MSTIFLVIAVILFVMEGINIKLGTVQLGWIGLAFFAGAFLVSRIKRLE